MREPFLRTMAQRHQIRKWVEEKALGREQVIKQELLWAGVTITDEGEMKTLSRKLTTDHILIMKKLRLILALGLDGVTVTHKNYLMLFCILAQKCETELGQGNTQKFSKGVAEVWIRLKKRKMGVTLG